MKTNSKIYIIVMIVILSVYHYYNYNFTYFAITDILGNSLIGVTWAQILSLTFCSVDIFWVVKVLYPKFSTFDYYLVGAWFLTVIMNALLLWWGLSLAISYQAIFPLDRIVTPAVIALIATFIRIFIVSLLFQIRK
jgi:hypothetical protein